MTNRGLASSLPLRVPKSFLACSGACPRPRSRVDALRRRSQRGCATRAQQRVRAPRTTVWARVVTRRGPHDVQQQGPSATPRSGCTRANAMVLGSLTASAVRSLTLRAGERVRRARGQGDGREADDRELGRAAHHRRQGQRRRRARVSSALSLTRCADVGFCVPAVDAVAPADIRTAPAMSSRRSRSACSTATLMSNSTR